MNIKDVDQSSIEVPADDHELIRGIFRHQEELMVEYRDIENMPDWPIPFQTKEGQVWFKSFMWRAHEELCEAEEALSLVDTKDPKLAHAHVTHFFEEMSDALHFLVELMIISGVGTGVHGANRDHDVLVHTWEDCDPLFVRPYQAIGEAFFSKPNTIFFGDNGNLRTVIDQWNTQIFQHQAQTVNDLCRVISYQLGLAGNVLKFKSWKRTAVMSDEDAYDNRVRNAVILYFSILRDCGLDPRDVYLLYMSKNLVNNWRQATKY